MRSKVIAGCCVLMALWQVAWIVGLVFGLIDLLGGRHHVTFDLLMIGVAALSGGLSSLTSLLGDSK